MVGRKKYQNMTTFIDEGRAARAASCAHYGVVSALISVYNVVEIG